MIFLAPKKKSFISLLNIIALTFTLSLPVLANTSDWGMVRHFEKNTELANNGNIQAMYDLGRLYERGRGTNKNLTQAIKWFQQAASNGNSAAQARLGILYFEGRGVKQNYRKAYTYLSAAAKENSPSALFQLANMYELGTGVTQNLQKAIAWYKKADKNGHYLAKAKVTRLEKSLNSGASINQATAPSPLIQAILKGHWLKRKSAVGYLPSNISSCAKDSYNSMHCTSEAQKRSTGSEIITYKTESIITATSEIAFNVEYRNNVLDITLINQKDGDGETIEQSASRIKKGKQSKKRSLKCILKNKTTSECSRGSTTFNLVRK